MKHKVTDAQKITKNFPNHIFSKKNTREWNNIKVDDIFSQKEEAINELSYKIKNSAYMPIVFEDNIIKNFLNKLANAKQSHANKINLKKMVNINLDKSPGINTHRSSKSKGVKIRKSSMYNLEIEKNFLTLEPNTIETQNYSKMTSANTSNRMLFKTANKDRTLDTLSRSLFNKPNDKKRTESSERIFNNFVSATPVVEKYEVAFSATVSPNTTIRDIKNKYEDQIKTIFNNKEPKKINKRQIRVSVSSLYNEKCLFERKIKNPGQIQNYTMIKIPKKKKQIEINHEDYTYQDLKQVAKGIKPKGVFVGDKKRFLSFGDENILAKDYYAEKMTEDFAYRNEKFLKRTFFVSNYDTKYNPTRLRSAIDNDSVDHVKYNHKKLNSLANNLNENMKRKFLNKKGK
jgi:hypothetical protein